MIDTKYLVDNKEIDPPEVGLPNKDDKNDTEIEEHWKPKDPYKHYDDIDPQACSSLDSQQYMILHHMGFRAPDSDCGYVFL